MLNNDIGPAIYAILTASAALSAIVGTRIYPDIGTQRGAYPLITYSVVSSVPYDTKNGPATVEQVRVQVDVHTYTMTQATQINVLVRSILDRYPTATAIGGIVIDGIQYAGMNPDDYDDKTKIYMKSQDFFIRVKELT